ncbi:MAG TPA: hypothetical protein PLC22_17490, partial [Gordonia sp. (in: high G+C Gram-positive bacteria)]|nr:hypothetical protein [Gordonia sp. (in: high G+C Gram-positive bacteria)]
MPATSSTPTNAPVDGRGITTGPIAGSHKHYKEIQARRDTHGTGCAQGDRSGEAGGNTEGNGRIGGHQHGGTLRVPQRRIALTNGDHLDVYDTSGPYTDPSADIAVERGLPPTRDSWHRPEPAPADP